MRGNGGADGLSPSRGRLSSLLERAHSSFWFLPGLMTTGAILLFALTLQFDQGLKATLSGLPLFFSGGATAARTVLSVISGSLITVVATALSLTIVILQLTSSSYTPRLLPIFMSDRGIQVILGAYVATFVYALLVLRVVRTPEGNTPAFVPVISITTAITLALACVALLIYFIHHVANLIQSSTIVDKAENDAMKRISRLEDLKASPPEAKDLGERPELGTLLREEPLVVRAKKSGYLQRVEMNSLLEAIPSNGEGVVVVQVPFSPGYFVPAGLPMLCIWPSPKDGPDPDAEKNLRAALVLGKERSFRQDLAFGLRQLSDIALKGVSPGVNDPTTSMQAMDRMEAIFVALGSKVLPRRVQEKEIGCTKIIVEAEHYGFEDVVGVAFDQLQRAAFTSGQVAVLERMIEILDRAIRANEPAERRQALWERALTVAQMAPNQVSNPKDACRLMRRVVEVGAYLVRAGHGSMVAADLEELAELSEELRGGEKIREAVGAALDGRGFDRRA